MKVLRSLLILAAVALGSAVSPSSAAGAASADSAHDSDLVTDLPGLDAASVSFKHYAGHLQLAAKEELFYWYTESQENPAEDPIVLWLNGGPGCSSLGGFFTENGPFVVNADLSVKLNRHSWNRKVNLVWLESPAGVGFSGPLQDADYYNDDVVAAKAHEFLELFFDKYSELKGRKFYITGESYAGMYIPYLVNLLVEKPIAGVDFAGFAIGNAYTDVVIDGNANIDYLYSHGIISLENFRAIQNECGREGIGCVFADEVCSDKCKELLDESVTAAEEDKFNPYFIYGDICLLNNNQTAVLRSAGKTKKTNLSITTTTTTTTSNQQRNDIGPCADTFTQEYLNQKEVQRALHVTNPVDWVDCSDEVGSIYTSSASALPKYPNILGKGLNVLIYSGDADSNVNFIGTERWLGEEGLKLHVTSKWKAWFGPDKQHAGYVQGYDGLTYKTVKGAGHLVPAVKPLHGLNMFECFVFGEKACATFAYPTDTEEIEAGELAATVDLTASVATGSTVRLWAPVLAVCLAIAAFVGIGAKNSKKRSSYEPIGSSVGVSIGAAATTQSRTSRFEDMALGMMNGSASLLLRVRRSCSSNSNSTTRSALQYVAARSFHRSVGIVGMPNVGKSTLFNALTKTENAQAANYPFCTIDPNIARVAVPDERVHRLAEIEKSQRVIETQLEFVDIAGLVRGASKGEGLGNKFLENIRQVAVIAHVVRCFEDTNILHVDESVDPIRDLETIRTELILSDLQNVEKRLQNLAKKKKSTDPTIPALLEVLERLQPHLEDGNQAHGMVFEKPEEQIQFERLQLLTAKKAMYLCNVSEDDAANGNEMTELVRERVEAEGSLCITVSGALEEAAASFEDEASQLEYLQESGLSETGLTKVIRASKDLLQLQTYYTVGEKEARAWNVPFGATAPVAAGVIHSDFERLFIRAETVAYDDFVRAGSMKAAKEKGYVRSEGKEYQCQDGDIYNFLVGK